MSLDAPNQTFLVNCHPLDSGRTVNSSITLHTMDDILRQLKLKRENFSLFLTDTRLGCSVRVFGWKDIRGIIPFFDACHLRCALNHCAMRVRAHFKNIDEVIATIKAATIKNKDRKKDFHDAGLPSPPDPVITR